MVSHTANNQIWLDMEKEIAELRAENERMENLLALDVHSCGPNCQRAGCVNRRLLDENEALRKDAERYRWLRDDANGRWLNKLMDEYTRAKCDCDRFDEAIDAAMKGQ